MGRMRFLFADEDSVIRICQLLAGTPLAIELAAAWSKMLQPGEILMELEKGVDILGSVFCPADAT